MINTTIEYQRAVLNNREFCVKDKITFRNKKSIALSLDDFMKYSIREATSGAGKFEVGAAVIKEYTAILDNSDGRFDDYDFEGADINAIVGLRLSDSSWELLDKGEYRIVKAVAKELTAELKAYDNMLFFDKPYSKSKLTYPASIYSIIQNACNDCQVVVDASSVLMKNFMVSQRPGDKNITYRDVISYCAQIMGCYARIDHLNQLSFGWYDFGAAGECYDGGTFIDYTSGDQCDGGTFSNYASGDDIDAGTFVDTDTFHHLYNISNQSVETGDIEITGVQIKVKTSGTEKEKIFAYGNEGYVIEISNNPMIDEKTASQVLSHIGPRLTGNRFRPMSISAQSNPAIESGDIAWVTDWKQRSFKTVLTSTDFVMGALQKIDCTAETPSEKEYTKYGAATKILSQAEENTEDQLSAYDIAVQQMNQLAANTFGFFSTVVPQEDGSVIAYRHNKPTLAQSKTVYKSGIDGFWVTQNYTGNDATTVWKAGFDSSGNSVLNILSVIGINFSWAHGGTLTLGGTNNGNGVLQVLDSAGTRIGLINKDGVDLRGIFKTGRWDDVYIKISGQSIEFYHSNDELALRLDAVLDTLDNSVMAGIDIGNNGSFIIGGRGWGMLQLWPYDDYKVKVLGNFSVNGTKSRLAKTENFADRLLYCYETPTPLFGDCGCGRTNVDGIAIIDIDPVFAETITPEVEYQVFLQKEGQGDLWVQEKEESYFVVNGSPNLKFSWELKCVQKQYEALRLDEDTQSTMISQDINASEKDTDDIIKNDVINYDSEMEELMDYEGG